MSKQEKFLLFLNILLYGALTVFSYSYVDLNLTISQIPIVLKAVGFLQQLGYFHRQEATLIYLVFLIFAFGFFIFNLRLFYKSKVGKTYLIASTVLNTTILIFAYPFLSSDLFNYLFDAKIILKYNASPYTHKPLDFPQDDWLRFMRWVHRYSPYGPLWLGFSILPAFLGLGKFIINFLTFKIFIGSFHLVNAFIIYKFLKNTKKDLALFGTAFYALNPLFLIEGVINAHNDIVLATFLLSAMLFTSTKKETFSFFSVLLGILIKYIPILILPFVVLKKLKKINQKQAIVLSIITMGLFTFIYSSFKVSVPFVSSGSTQVQFQPWYLFWTLPLLALLAIPELIVAAILVSIGASLRYLPYLLNGDWSHPGTTNFMQVVTVIPLIISLIFILLRKSALK